MVVINPWQAVYMRPARVTFIVFFVVLILVSMVFGSDGMISDTRQYMAILTAAVAAFYSWRYLSRKRRANRVADKAHLHGR